MSKVKIKVADTLAPEGYSRYAIGDKAKVIEYKSRLAEGRTWHYKVRLEHTPTTSDGRNLSRTVFFTKDQVAKTR